MAERGPAVISERLETSRLLLTRVAVEDADELFEHYLSDPEASLYMPWPPHGRIEQTRGFLQRRVEEWNSGATYAWTVRWRDSGLVTGMADVSIDGHKAILGYGFSPDVWGKGVGTEAVSVVVEMLMNLPGLRRIWATCDIDNVGSVRLLEKVGMTREAVLHQWDHHNVSEEPRDCLMYAMWRSADGEWASNGPVG